MRRAELWEFHECLAAMKPDREPDRLTPEERAELLAMLDEAQ